MFKKLVDRISLALTSKRKSKDVTDNHQITEQFRKKCLQFTQQHPIASSSTYFKVHSPAIDPALLKKVQNIENGIKKCSGKLQLLLSKIILQIVEQEGLFFLFIKLWISGFCVFQINKIVDHYKLQNQKRQKGMSKDHQTVMNVQNNKSQNYKDIVKSFINDDNMSVSNYSKMTASKKPLNILSNIQVQQQKIQKIKSFFHKQFFLLCYFIYELALFFYQDDLTKCQQFETQNLFTLIRNSITSVRYCSQIHQLFRQHINCRKMDFSQEQIKENMGELQKMCKISKIPAAFMQSSSLLNEFVKIAQIQKKLKKCTLLINKIKQQVIQYRKVNHMEKQYVFCADDVLTALTYVMWRLRKNLYGPCVYVQLILCCEYQQFSQQKLAEELNSFQESTRHSFDTIRSVSKIGLLQADKVYNLI